MKAKPQRPLLVSSIYTLGGLLDCRISQRILRGRKVREWRKADPDRVRLLCKQVCAPLAPDGEADLGGRHRSCTPCIFQLVDK